MKAISRVDYINLETHYKLYIIQIVAPLLIQVLKPKNKCYKQEQL